MTPARSTRKASSEGDSYRFDTLTLSMIMADARFGRGELGPGDPIPEFDLATVDGGRFRSSDITAGKPVLMVFGSSTCHMTDSAVPGLKRLQQRFGDDVRFVLVNVREAHPGELVPQPRSDAEKHERAQALRGKHVLPFEVAVDDIDGTVHRRFGPKPNSAYLLGPDGTVWFRAHWASDEKALGAALRDVARGDRPTPATSGAMLRALMRGLGCLEAVLTEAGPKARRDLRRAVLPMAVLNSFARPWKRLSPARRGVAALVTLAVGIGAIAPAVILAT